MVKQVTQSVECKLVPELYCSCINTTLAFYTTIFGFSIQYQRPEDNFAYLSLDGVDIMVEEITEGVSTWLTAEMNQPFGRGINFQWQVIDLDTLYERVQKLALHQIFLPLEQKSYRRNDGEITQRQFIAKDSDGYLFRFCSVV
jgi:catechol 2,3-dioxygenase-like lactoylglutathione lyase family enzyme